MEDTVETPDEFPGEFVEQLQPDDTLIDRGVADALDEGYLAPDHWSAGEGYGSTPAEARAGETLAMRLKQEEPEADNLDGDWRQGEEGRECGGRRAGRLVVHGDDGLGGSEDDVFAYEAGIDGGAASAEEAAMHVIDEDEDLDDE